MNEKEKRELDAYITGYHREEKDVTIPANTELTCPVCDTEFTTRTVLRDDSTLTCPNCDAKLVVEDGDLEEVEEDIFAEVEDEEDEEEEEEFEDEDLEAEREEDEHDRRMEEERKIIDKERDK